MRSVARRESRKETWSRFWRFGHRHDRSCRRRGTPPDPDRVRHELLRRGGGGNRQDDRAGRPHRRAGPHRRRHARPDRRGHLHREGGRRDEASPPQRDREGANGSDARSNATGWTARSRSWSLRASARSTPSAATFSLSGRSRQGSTRSSKLLARTRPRRSPTKLSSAGSRGILADPPEGVRRILRRRSGWQSPREQLRGAMQQSSRAPRFSGALAPRSLRPEWRDRHADGRAGPARSACGRELVARRLSCSQPGRDRALRRRDDPPRGCPRSRLRRARGGAARA